MATAVGDASAVLVLVLACELPHAASAHNSAATKISFCIT